MLPLLGRKMKSKVGIIGRGNAGSAIKRGLDRSGYEVRIVGSDPKAVDETARWADLLILAVPFSALPDAAKAISEGAKDKTVVDVTNIVGPNVKVPATSGAKELQMGIPESKVVKSFNMVFAQNMDSGRAANQQITLFMAGDDKDAKKQVGQLATDIGFDPVDVGALDNAKLLESLGNLVIQIGYAQGLGTNIGFKLVR
jgi:8-hydroxy-5-deazaflavin:NADPH oxidoreductase